MINYLGVVGLAMAVAAPVQEMAPVLSPQKLSSSAHGIAVAESLLNDAQNAYQKVNDYTAKFLKQELIANRLRKEEVIEFKFQKQFKIYMGWIDSPDKGMEVIYQEGQNDNKIIAHLGGFLSKFVPTAYLALNDSLATHNNRHLVTDSGIGEFLKHYEADFKRGKERGEMQVILHGEENVYGRKTHKVEALLPKSKDNGYYCYRSVVYFDAENKLPIKMEFYDANDSLVENYGYKDLKTNVDLTEKDFDPKNETYHF